MLRSLAVEALVVRGFRNFVAVDLELGSGLNVFSGANGQGKTNLLEAMYVLATSRSFRTPRLSELVRNGAEDATIRGRVREDGAAREQVVALRRGVRSARIDGKRPATLAAYALRTPAVVFHPGALTLTAGGGSERRKLLDRVALYRSAAVLGASDAYTKAMRARQRVLDVRGENERDLDGWEEIAAEHGTALSNARAEAAEVLLAAAAGAFERIGPVGTVLTGRYERSSPVLASEFRAELARRRRKDRARGSASIGPHRDDVALELSQKSVRAMASQGQHRAVVLALKLAEIEVVTAARGLRPLLLLDDVSSELDRERTAALFSALSEQSCQVLMTTTRPELIVTRTPSGVEARRDFEVVSGQISGR
ncbi:MAG TPA: DNA replication and repair protein RecF [Polyangiaceae bacterium]|nr:DNA replication and repair protein RecF [Polyangiaceae bacterium]